ncbi:MAG: tetratricopeptide repeat protein [Xanthomonadales bacterium]|nr:tetratricopeptide repeat protein [Xanthomonadales bacterium]
MHPDLKRYRFGDFEIDPSAHQLLRAGELVPVQGLVFDLLLFLVRHPGEVLSKERLLAEVWDNQHLTDATIAQAVHKARVALGDDGRTQTYIRTVHGRGVRFEADVQEVLIEAGVASTEQPSVPGKVATAQQTHGRSGRFSWLPVLLVLAMVTTGVAGWRYLSVADDAPPPATAVAVAAPAIRVAVFAFDNATGDSDFDWFRNGLATATRDLIDQSPAVAALGPAELDDVPEGDLPRRTSFVGASHGLEASVSRVDGRFRVNWTLAGSNLTAATGKFDAADVTLIARDLARVTLDATGGRSPTQVPGERDIGDPLAVELYSRGIEALMHDDREQATALLAAALVRSPDSIPLKLAAARAAFDPGDVNASIQKLRERLDALPPTARQMRTSLQFEIGNLLWYVGEVAQAQTLLGATLAEPDLDPLLHARILNSLAFAEQSQLRYDLAWEHARQAEVILRDEQRPFFLSMTLTNLGYLAEDMGRIAEAGQYHDEAMLIREQYGFPSLIAASRYGRARILRRSGRFEEAAAELQRALQTVAELDLRHDLFDNTEELAEVRMRQGDFEQARQLLDRAREIAQSNDDALGLAWERQVRSRLMLRRNSVDGVSLAAQRAVIADFEAMGERQDALRARLELAQMHLALGNADAASRPLQDVHDSGDGFDNNPVLKLEYELIDAQRQAMAGQSERALAAMLGVVRRARSIGVLDIEAEAAIAAGQLAVTLGDTATAGRMLSVARAWSSSYYRTVELAEALAADTPAG